jgi:hypothetical protein
VTHSHLRFHGIASSEASKEVSRCLCPLQRQSSDESPDQLLTGNRVHGRTSMAWSAARSSGPAHRRNRRPRRSCSPCFFQSYPSHSCTLHMEIGGHVYRCTHKRVSGTVPGHRDMLAVAADRDHPCLQGVVRRTTSSLSSAAHKMGRQRWQRSCHPPKPPPWRMRSW